MVLPVFAVCSCSTTAVTTRHSARVETAHFVIDNDIIHRLGGGDPTKLKAVGGSWHVNGNNNVYQFDFVQKEQNGKVVQDSSGTAY